MAKNDNSGCLSWVVLLVGLVPGAIIGLVLPKNGQFIALVVSVVAIVFCCIMSMVYKKPQFSDETFWHACKRYMWGMFATLALGTAIALGYAVFGDKNQPSNNDGGAKTVEQVEK